MMRTNLLVVLLILSGLATLPGCGDSDSSDPDGDQVQSDGDESDGDLSDGDSDAPIDGDVIDGDEIDGNISDGDEPVDCNGECDPNTYPLTCIDEMNFCSCSDGGVLESQNCEAFCWESCQHAAGCGSNPNTGMDECSCWSIGEECVSDEDCICKGMDYCVSMGDSAICATRCDIELCSKTVGCLNVSDGGNCGICLEKDQPTCSTVGEDCSTGGDGSRTCSDICTLTDASCYQNCEAAPNTCNESELCFPLVGDAQGTIIDGICINYGADCPTCGMMDGDVDSDGDDDIDEGDVDGDTVDKDGEKKENQ